MTESELQEHIEGLTADRRRAWKVDPSAVPEITKQIEEAYGALRAERARAINGDRDEIVKRARIERELEKLMGTEAQPGT